MSVSDGPQAAQSHSKWRLDPRTYLVVGGGSATRPSSALTHSVMPEQTIGVALVIVEALLVVQARRKQWEGPTSSSLQPTIRWKIPSLASDSLLPPTYPTRS